MSFMQIELINSVKGNVIIPIWPNVIRFEKKDYITSELDRVNYMSRIHIISQISDFPDGQ